MMYRIVTEIDRPDGTIDVATQGDTGRKDKAIAAATNINATQNFDRVTVYGRAVDWADDFTVYRAVKGMRRI